MTPVLFKLPGEKTVTTCKTSEILGLWFVWSIVTPARNLRNHHLLRLHVLFTSRKNYSSTLGDFSQHTLSEEILCNEFAVYDALLSCHGTADCDMNYLNWTNWLLHSSSRSLCGQSLDVHCRLERIKRKTLWTCLDVWCIGCITVHNSVVASCYGTGFISSGCAWVPILGHSPDWKQSAKMVPKKR